MLLNELMNTNPAVQHLIGKINLAISAEEKSVLSQKLQNLGIKPTISNLKNYMLKCLTVPIDEVPLPERTIILRSGRPERFE